MSKSLKEQFNTIRDKEEVLAEIFTKETFSRQYNSWPEDQQNLFLDYCTGIRGIKILNDCIFKLVMNPDTKPQRLERILSLLLGEDVRILQVLPNESTRIAAERTLLVMDIIVELTNGIIANVEVQRIGYAFPGQRSACYSADLLMRQYKRIKAQKKKKFRYSDINKVYTIVFFEKSSGEFLKFSDTYIHRSKQQTDTGININLLQEYVFLSLDIFRKNLHNKGVNKENELEAWLTFLSEDDPEWILQLIKVFPQFRELYREVYHACQNMEVMMGFFSEELLELDQNTIDFMIDEMQAQVDELQTKIDEMTAQTKEIQSQKEELQARSEELQARSEELQARSEELQAQTEEQKELLKTQEIEIKEKDTKIKEKDNEIAMLKELLVQYQ